MIEGFFAREALMRRFVLLLLLLTGADAVLANQRIALVLGNDAYPDSPLANPANDARAVSAALENLGFEVVTRTDASLAAMQDALLEFTGRIEDGATAMVYYAGHGIQADGRNYLIPVDAGLQSASRLRFEALELGDVLEELDYSKAKLKLVVLDACRNNPFLRSFRGGNRGLAAVDAASGTLIAYATAPGAVASDGRGDNGLYTEHFLRALAQPGLQAEAMFKAVRIGVSEASGGEQIPWESSSLTGDFVFNQSSAMPSSATLVEIAAPSPRDDADARFWAEVSASERAADFEAYLARFPSGLYALLARNRIDALAEQAAAANRCDDLSGRWYERRDDRTCASDLWLEAGEAEDGYVARTAVCPAEGALGALSSGTSSGDARIEDGVLVGTWRHGPCSGTTRYTLDAQCTRGEGEIVGTRGLFGACARIRLASTIERAD